MTAAADGVVRSRLDAFLESEGYGAVWFGRSNNFAWVTGGNNAVVRSEEPGAAAVGYDGTFRVVTSDIEADRLRVEELPPGTTVESFPWHERCLAEAVREASPTSAAADFDVDGLDDVDASRLRQPLTEPSVERYRRLGETVAAAVEQTCRTVDPETPERAVAADVQCRLAESGVETPVLLVGGDGRASSYRHFVPTDEPIGDYAVISVTARRHGLHASCTRTVAFDPPDWLRERHEAAARVEVSALEATRRVARVGGTAGDVFATIEAAYEAVGHEGEWRHHHQGGATGYASREWIASPGHGAPVTMPMAYAWNPTVRGAKSEDTVLVTADGFEVLTDTGAWPTVRLSPVEGSADVPRPDVLVRS